MKSSRLRGPRCLIPVRQKSTQGSPSKSLHRARQSRRLSNWGKRSPTHMQDFTAKLRPQRTRMFNLKSYEPAISRNRCCSQVLQYLPGIWQGKPESCLKLVMVVTRRCLIYRPLMISPCPDKEVHMSGAPLRDFTCPSPAISSIPSLSRAGAH